MLEFKFQNVGIIGCIAIYRLHMRQRCLERTACSAIAPLIETRSSSVQTWNFPAARDR